MSVTASKPAADENDSAAGTFTVKRTGSEAQLATALTVAVSFSGSAALGTDYSTLPKMVTFSAGVASADVNITPIDDSDFEGPETVILTVESGSKYSVDSENDAATVTIADNDKPLVSVAALDSSAAESGTAAGTYRISRTGITQNPLLVKVTLSGTALNGTDYTSLKTTQTLAAGQSYVDVKVVPKDDSIFEDTETVVLTMAASPDYVVDSSAGVATVSIEDNDIPSVSIAASTTGGTEGSSTDIGKFTLTRTGATTSPLTLNFTVAGSAIDGTDYTSIGSTATIPAGKSSVDITIKTIQDSEIEPLETVVVTLVPADHFIIDSIANAATATLTDDDKPTVKITLDSGAAAETGAHNTGVFTISRDGPTVESLSVPLTISGTATGGKDYKTLAGSVTIPIGKSSIQLLVTPLDDTLVEGEETVIITLGSGAFIADSANKTATVTIADDDIPDVSIAATDAMATEPASDKGVFTITRSAATAAALEVHYAISGSATNGTDYTTITGTATIPAGKNSITVTIAPKDDASVEGSETVFLALSSGAGYDLDPYSSSALVTIKDNDKPIVSVVASDAAAAEVEMAIGKFTISRSGATGDPLSITYGLSGTASKSTDYAVLDLNGNNITGAITFAAGESSKVVVIKPVDDRTVELDEVVTLTLTSGPAFALDPLAKSASVKIVDDDLPTVGISATDISAGEPGDAGSITITRNGPTSEALAVLFQVSGTAIGGADYAALGSAVSIPVNKSSIVLSIAPADDTSLEGRETVIVSLTGGAFLIDPKASSATVNIADNEKPMVTIETSDDSMSEGSNGDGTASFTFTRSGSAASMVDELSVLYSLSGSATPGSDTVEPLKGTAIIPAGSASATVTITQLDDSLVETDELLILTLRASNSYLLNKATPNNAMVVIHDDEKPSVGIVAVVSSAKENKGVLTYTVTRTGQLQNALGVYLDASSSTVGSTDLTTAIPNYVTIPAGKRTATVVVTSKDDPELEGDETVLLKVAPDDASLISATAAEAVGIIADDEKPPAAVSADGTAVVSVLATDAIGAEPGTNKGVFTITRGGSTGAPLTVGYALSGSATPGADYAALPGMAIIPAGKKSVTISLNPKDDTEVEGTETAILTLSSAQDYELDPNYNQGSIQITDNDKPKVSLVVSDSKSSEQNSAAGTFTLVRSGTPTDPLTVSYTFSGTATKSTDYVVLDADGNSVLTGIAFAAGESSKVITIKPIDDSEVELDEKVILTLAGGSGYIVDSAAKAGTGILADNDPPTVSIVATDATAAEPGDKGTITITRNGPTAEALTVSLTVGGTATAGIDYRTIGSSATIPVGKKSIVLTVAPADDTLLEGRETVSVALANAKTYVSDAKAKSAVAQIADNEKPTIKIAAVNGLMTENSGSDGTAAFTFTRSGSTASAVDDLTVLYTVSGTATTGTDTTEVLTGTAIIPAGSLTKTITLVQKNDSLIETDETVVLSLKAAAAYAISSVASQKAAAVIIHDDERPVVSIVAVTASAKENKGVLTYSISRTGQAHNPLTVYLDTPGGSAEAADLSANPPTTVTIPAGKSSINLNVTSKDDKDLEETESLALSIAGDISYSISNNAADATVRIVDDEKSTVTISATDDTADEGDRSSGTFTITRTGPASDPLTVNLAIAGTAKSGVDYGQIAKSITIPSGVHTIEIAIVPETDSIVEGPETVILNLGAGAYTIGAGKSATVTIADEQKSRVSVEAIDPSEDGADTATFRIWRTGQAASQTLLVNFELSSNGSNPEGLIIKDSDGKVLTTSVIIPTGLAYIDLLISRTEISSEGQMPLELKLMDGSYQREPGHDMAHGSIE